MIVFLIGIYLYAFAVQSVKQVWKSWTIPTYFLTVLGFAFVSIRLFPLSGDEILYDRCGQELAQWLPGSLFQAIPLSDFCQYGNSNFFVRFSGLLYAIGGSSYFDLVAFNALITYIASDLTLRSFQVSEFELQKIFRWSLFFPPLLYLSVRPAKEATVAFLISLGFFAVNHKNRIAKLVLVPIAGLLFYFIRWQFLVVYLVSILLFLIWQRWVELSNRLKIVAIFVVAIIIMGLWAQFKAPVLARVYSTTVNPEVIKLHQANTSGGAVIYRLMDGENVLSVRNFLIAHVGGLFTPHPLRFIKEYLRDGNWDANVIEEFLFASLWFYLLLPVFCLYLYRRFFKNIFALEKVPLADLFNLIFALLLFSASCLSLFLSSPQSFRYKVPLNVYFLMAVTLFIYQTGIRSFFHELRASRVFLLLYCILLTSYSVFYLGTLR